MKMRESLIGYFIQQIFMESFLFFQELDLKDENTCSLTSKMSASRRGDDLRSPDGSRSRKGTPAARAAGGAVDPRGKLTSVASTGSGSARQDFYLFIYLFMFSSQRKGKRVSVSMCEALQEDKVTG